VLINVHFLIHLSQSVLDWGCLWTTSSFIPEWFNGVLMSFSNGTQAIADKMASNYLLKLLFVTRPRRCYKYISTMKQKKTLRACQRRRNGDFQKKQFRIKMKSNFFDIHPYGMLPQIKKNVLRSLLAQNSDSRTVSFKNAKFFSRIKLFFLGSIFAPKNCKRSPKRVNFFAWTNNGEFLFI
jgi:hypothetical protein